MMILLSFALWTLQQCHNERNSVSNHQRLGCLRNCLFDHKIIWYHIKPNLLDLNMGFHQGLNNILIFLPLSYEIIGVGRHIQYIPRNMHTVFALLCFVVVIHWLISPYPSGLLHWHCGNLTIAPVPAKQPWWIWINTPCGFIMNDCVTTTKQSTKPCACFLGYTVCALVKISHHWVRQFTVTCSTPKYHLNQLLLIGYLHAG